MENMLGSALAEAVGPLKDFLEKLSGLEGSKWFEAFKLFLRKEEPWPVFPVWKTITIGTYKAVSRLKADLINNGFQISKWVDDILDKITLSSKKTKLNLVMATVAELGFKDGAYFQDICKRVLELGELCPAEVGPQLRLQYKDQPMSEWILVVMKPITASDGSLNVFLVARYGAGAWLSYDDGGSGGFWHGGYRVVFVRRK